MPQIVIRTGFKAPDGHEEKLTEYFCDWPDCRNVATHVLGCSKELGTASAVCQEHISRDR
jgi:hypothetical protein